MARKPPATPQEMWDLVLRRKWWILTPMVVVPVLVFFIGLRLPKQYQSEAVILVDPAKIPADIVKGSSDLGDRLQAIREEVMSRTRLESIAIELNLYPKAQASGNMDRVADAMQKDITVDVIKAEGEGDRGPIEGFRIGYTASKPEVAQQVVKKVGDLFIQENLQIGSAEVQGTNDFLSQELRQAKAQLDAQDQKIRAFKAAHMGTLPEQESSNIALISQDQSLLQSNSEAIDRANQQRVYLESMLNADGGSPKQKMAPAAPTVLELQLQAAKEQLSVALQKYTDSYPDVISLRGQIASLEQQIRNAPRNHGSTVMTTGPTIGQQLQSQLTAIDEEIKSRTARMAGIEAQLNALQGRVNVLPAVQSEYQDLTRDYDDINKHYQDLLEKQQNSGMAAQLQKQQQSSGFQIVDPASLPRLPSGPNLLLIDIGGVLGGVLLGVLLGLIMDVTDATLHSPDEVERYFDLPMIVALPSLNAKFEGQGKRGPKRLSSRAA